MTNEYKSCLRLDASAGGGHAHKTEGDLNLEIVICYGAAVHWTDDGHDTPGSLIAPYN